MASEGSIGILQHVLGYLELPDSAYESAAVRYKDLGEWLCRDGSSCAEYQPHVFAQGSFRLGTAIRPLTAKEEYDLDLACELSSGATKSSHTQRSVKQLVGREVEAYRVARGIRAEKEKKHRCWRLEYADDLSFHLDIVPCIPEVDARRQSIQAAMTRLGEGRDLAVALSELTVSITDDRHPRYGQICDNWDVSNPEGYARWFESRMRLAPRFLFERAEVLKAASIDDLPVYSWRTPLQQAVQLLKRHRDQMFRDDPDVKPVSIIITTLAGRAYSGETDVASAMHAVLSSNEHLVGSDRPRIPNPVNPDEDFSDRWTRSECLHLDLEGNFWRWVMQARNDFLLLGTADDAGLLAEQARRKFAVGVDVAALSQLVGLHGSSAPIAAPKVHAVPRTPPRPWGGAGLR